MCKKQNQILNIKDKLIEIDIKSIRPLRNISNSEDYKILFELENEARILRKELQELQESQTGK